MNQAKKKQKKSTNVKGQAGRANNVIVTLIYNNVRVSQCENNDEILISFLSIINF